MRGRRAQGGRQARKLSLNRRKPAAPQDGIRNLAPASTFSPDTSKEGTMLKGGLLWLIGIPIPIIILLWLFGFLS